MDYLERYSRMLADKRVPFVEVDGQLFARQQKWIAPMGPAAQPYTLTPRQAGALQKKLGGLWISWTEGFSTEPEASEWYAVICRDFISLDRMPGKRRYEINRGLKNCEVRRVEASEIARHGYEVYTAALQGYANGKATAIPSADQFAGRVSADLPFADIKHHWAVYHQERMVAFAQCYLYDRVEVDYTLIKLDPKYLNLYPAYALLYRMNEFYLGEQKFEYVNDGWRSVFHDTGVQEFLIGKFNFEKRPARLRMHFRPPLAALLRLATPLHSLMTRMDRRLGATLELRRIGLASGGN